MEEENYRALADAIFEREETQENVRAKKVEANDAAECSKKTLSNEKEDDTDEEAQTSEELQRPLKRLRLRYQECQSSSLNKPTSDTTRAPVISPKEEPDELPENQASKLNRAKGLVEPPPQNAENTRAMSRTDMDKGKKPVTPDALTVYERGDSCQLNDNRRSPQISPLRTYSRSASHTLRLRDGGKDSVSPQVSAKEKSLLPQSSSIQSNEKLPALKSSSIPSKEKRPVQKSSSDAIQLKEPEIEPVTSTALLKHKDEPVSDEMPDFEIPIAVIHPDQSNGDPSAADGTDRRASRPGPPVQQSISEPETTPVFGTQSESISNEKLDMVTAGCSSILEITSSPSGEVKISLHCDLSLGRPDFQMPNLEAVLKLVEDKCLKSYKTVDPDFSVMNIMKETCNCFLKLGTESSDELPNNIDVSSSIDLVNRSSAACAVGSKGQFSASLNTTVDSQFDSEVSRPITLIRPLPWNGIDDSQPSKKDGADEIGKDPRDQENHAEETNFLILPLPCNGIDDSQRSKKDGADEIGKDPGNQENHTEETNLLSLVVIQKPQVTPDVIRSLHNVVDIAKGQENVIITLVNEVNDECPPSFHYIPRNALFQNAYINFSLARIGDNNSCSACSSDCLSLSTPCACAHETGGEFAYTTDGLVKEELLKECISMNRDPKKHCQFFCTECPLERTKSEDISEPCKGHLVRKFIKECWWKCGCSKQCGNRVVQRGINRNLQVFMTPEAKGWGLRTLEEIPKGTFVCEYVGEVLTNAELFDRVLRSSKGEKHSYPVLLDADWCAEGVLKDEEALCLDATYYGNVARFINHRCYDSNLVEIPVEIETPDHHYYHLAFFTTRKVKAMEELTWDYGIDFDDNDHPIKAFRCQCGSKFCRNIKRSRSRARRW